MKACCPEVGTTDFGYRSNSGATGYEQCNRRFDRFRTGKQLARFCGLSPRNASSGTRQADAGLVKAGNPELRAVLIELAHRLIRWEARWRELGLKLKGGGKPGSVAAAAVANRWVRWLYHEMTTVA